MLELARAYIQEYEPTYHTALLRGLACQALGRQEEAMHHFCLAARLNPDESVAADALYPLVETFGFSPKTDLAAMRRRLGETFVELEPQPRMEALADPPLVTVVVADLDADSCRRSLMSVARQDYDEIDVLIPEGVLCDADIQHVIDVRVQSTKTPLKIRTTHNEWCLNSCRPLP